MSTQLSWYVARAGGLAAWVSLSATVVVGLLAATRLPGRRASPAALQRVHRYLGELTMMFVGVHIVGLVSDTYVHFGVVDLFVPFASSWHPVAVAFGVVAFWTLVAVWLTSLVRGRLSPRMWHAVHMSSYVTYVATTVHLISAGTDAWSPVIEVLNLAVATAVALLATFALARHLSRPARTPARVPSGASPRHLVAQPLPTNGASPKADTSPLAVTVQ